MTASRIATFFIQRLRRTGADGDRPLRGRGVIADGSAVFRSLVWPLLSLHSGIDRIEWDIGPVARECVHYFNAVLGA